MTDAERIAAAIEEIRLATAGARVNERAARRLGRRLSRWLRRRGVHSVSWAGSSLWYTGRWGFYTKLRDGYLRAGSCMVWAIADHVVEAVEAAASCASLRGDNAYTIRHKLREMLRRLGAL